MKKTLRDVILSCAVLGVLCALLWHIRWIGSVREVLILYLLLAGCILLDRLLERIFQSGHMDPAILPIVKGTVFVICAAAALVVLPL